MNIPIFILGKRVKRQRKERVTNVDKYTRALKEGINNHKENNANQFFYIQMSLKCQHTHG